jgi:hypothetical protein
MEKQVCARCEYLWANRVEAPKNCPRCKSPYWNRPRKNKIAVAAIAREKTVSHSTLPEVPRQPEPRLAATLDRQVDPNFDFGS